MLERVSRSLPAVNQNVYIGTSVVLIAAVILIARRLFSTSVPQQSSLQVSELFHLPSDPVSHPLSHDAHLELEKKQKGLPRVNTISFAKLQTRITKYLGYENMVVPPRRGRFFYYEMTEEILERHLKNEGSAIMITVNDETYSCGKKEGKYHLYGPYNADAKMNGRNIFSLDFETLQELSQYLTRECSQVTPGKQIQIEQFIFALLGKTVTFELFKNTCETAILFHHSPRMTQEEFENFNRDYPLDHPGNLAKLASKLFGVTYQCIVIFQLVESGS